MGMNILVTGGAGYIGSHTAVVLLEAGHDLILVDNFCNSKPEALEDIRAISGRDFVFVQADLRDRAAVERAFADHAVDAVIHFAGLKAVGESVAKPLEYYDNNLIGTLVLLEVMRAHGVKRMVFSSSATVYGMNNPVPLKEEYPTSAINPYGYTKVMIEQMLRDLGRSDDAWAISLLRYFNPIGAHPSGRIGEDPNDIPNNLLPYVAQVAAGRLEKVHVFGNDYATRDGTGVRDYIHVTDLAKGHVAALKRLENGQGVSAYNLGTGTGYTVLEVLSAFERACGKVLPYEIVGRRPGDIAECYADPSKAAAELGWRAEYGIERMCQDAWRWQQNNPNGYED